MPIYEYKCEKCGEVFEEHRSVKAKPMEHCKSCNGKVKRIYSPVGIVFKGPGFHVTDYKKDGKPQSASSTSSKSPVKEHDKPAEKPADKSAERPSLSETKPSDKTA